MTDTDRPLRADARRNREKILCAAQEVFDEQGVCASTEEVAKRAGVGVGTVFRHFPTKETLLVAVYVETLRGLVAEADRLADAPDPGAAFFGFVRHMVERSAGKNAYAEALAEAGVEVKQASSTMGPALRRALGTLLERAQRAGRARPDVDVPALIALLVGAARMMDHAADDPGSRACAVSVILDGLRAMPAG